MTEMIVNGKTIRKIANGFIIFNLTDIDGEYYVPNLKKLRGLISRDDRKQVKKYLIDENIKGKGL